MEEGVLFGVRYIGDRCTYLTDDIREAKCYGTVILEVEYDPFEHKEMNNYDKNSWQMRAYEPIGVDKIRRIE